jgi:hypothetical protein
MSDEITELVNIDPERIDGVLNPANGIPILMMKSVAVKDVNAVGGIDEKPDIAGADRVLAELYRLVESEAREGAVGAQEDCDIHILSEAISLIRCFRENELWGDEDDGSDLGKSADGLVFKAHRKFSSDERKSLAAEGKALPDGSYPIPDADALRRAAILARSGHGDVAAAKRLIAKRAKELGVANPLASDTTKDAPEDVTPETPAADEPQGGDEFSKDSVAKMIEDAKTEVSKAYEERVTALEADLAKVLATPIPGQVAIAAPESARNNAARDQSAAEAARFRALAKSVDDRELAKYYDKRAAEAEKAAA